MVWKLGTVVFGIATILLLARDVTRPDPLRSPSAPPEKRTANLVIAPGELGEQDSEIVDEEHPAAVSGGAPPSRAFVDPRWLSESPRALVARLVPRRVENVESRTPWEGLARALEARREEVLPVLADWLGRLPEIGRNGGYYERLPAIYAKLAGRGGVARLEALARGPWAPGLHVRALASIRDPAAVAAIRRLQESAEPNRRVIHLDQLARTEAGLDLVREWSLTPPETQEHLRAEATRVLMSRGTDADREEVWRRSTREERVRLTDRRMRWQLSPPWPERVRAIAVAGLDSGDRSIRLLAVQRIVRDPEAFSAGTVAAADRVIAVELEVEPTTEHGIYVKKRFEELRGWRAAREKRLEEEKAYEAFLAGL